MTKRGIQQHENWPVAPVGHGIGLRNEHFSRLLEAPPSGVGWFEVISENLFEPGGRPWAVIDRVRAELPVVLHGVSMGVGNVDQVPRSYLDRLKTVIERVDPLWVSDHLCWGGFGGHYAHDLLPLPYNEDVVRHVAQQVRRVQETLGRRILLENVSSYVAFAQSELTEWEFVNAVAEEADCGILLDVNNVYVSARNHGFVAERYVDAINAERVGQIHVAGHTDKGTYLLDSHVGPVSDPVWRLYRRAIARLGPIPTLVEWDEEVPAYETVVAEARRAAAIEAEVVAAQEGRDAA